MTQEFSPQTLAIDTNVLLSALVSRGLCHDLLNVLVRAHTSGHLVVVVPSRVLNELVSHLTGKFKIPRGLVEKHLQSLALFQQANARREPSVEIPDPDDLPIIAQALAANADPFITGDKALLALSQVDGMRIMSPREAFERFRPRAED